MNKVKYQNRDEWLAARNEGVGSSDAPIILGLSKHTSPVMLYAQKLGLAPPQEQNEAMKWGLVLQPLVLAAYAEETKRTVSPCENELWMGEHPFMLSPDGTVEDKEKGLGLMEAKTASIFVSDDWRDEPPIQAQVQVQHGLIVTGYEWGSIAGLLGGQKLVWADVTRHESFILLLRDRIAEFWRRIELRDPPPPDASASAREALKILYPKESGEMVTLPAEAAHWHEERVKASADQKDAEARYDLSSNHLRAMIGPNLGGVLPDGTAYTLKTVSRKGYTVEPTEFRQLRKLK